MPTPDLIVQQLTTISNEWRTLAIGWHAVGAIALLAVAAGWQPSRTIVARLIVVPCWSVAALAWYYGNPFNGVVFTSLGVALTIIAVTMARVTPSAASKFERRVGAVLIVFGLIYPHFLDARSWLATVYESPFGLIPCPTLSVVAGVSLLVHGFDSRAWASILAAALAFYGLFGAVVLSVRIDVVLLAGALGLLRLAFQLQPRRIAGNVGDFSRAA